MSTSVRLSHAPARLARALGIGGGTRARLPPSVAGASPGTLFPQPDAAPTTLHWLRYSAKAVEGGTVESIDKLKERCALGDGTFWLDIRGLGSPDLLQELGRVYDIHPLALADMVNVPQRPKTELYDNHTIVTAHMLHADTTGLRAEQISVLLGDGFVITVQENDHDGDVLEPVRRRIRQSHGRIRSAGADYLTYALLDCIVDAYFPVLEQISQRLEDLELPALERPMRTTGKSIYELKRTLLHARRSIWPLRDALHVLLREDEHLTETTRVYVRDVLDHTVQVTDLIETYREFAATLMDLYLSSVNNRMNEVVKVLTIISTIFLPLSFIAGIYGMNFDGEASRWNMPELRWIYGYPFALGLMGAVGLGMLIAFRRAGWLGGKRAAATGRAF